MVEHLAQLPNVRTFVDRVAGDLQQGISTLVLLNPMLDQGLFEELSLASLHAANVWLEEIDLAVTPSSKRPFDHLCHLLLSDTTARKHCTSVPQLLRQVNLPEVIMVRNLPAICDKRKDWLDFLGELAEAAHGVASSQDVRPPALLVCLAPASGDMLPNESPRLHLHWWWSIMTALEIRLVLRTRHRLPHSSGSAQAAWREFVLPPLVGSDLALADALWESVLRDFDVVFAQLRSIASERGWRPKLLRELQVDKVQPPRSSRAAVRSCPSGAERRLWAHGLLDHVDELGTIVSSAALAVLDDTEAIRHRMWRGQAALILPLLDEIRLDVCRNLLQSCGDLWITHWMGLDGVAANEMAANPFSAEWGQIEFSLQSAPRTAPSTVGRLLPAVQQARSVRNRLAHYTPVSFSDYTLLLHNLG